MMQAYNVNKLIKEPTCFQLNNPNQINFILPNIKSMQNFSNTFATGVSDHDKLISTISKSVSFKKTTQIKVINSINLLI